MRKSAPFILADCPEDLSRLRQLQSVATGEVCVSELEWLYTFFVKAELPDDIATRDGSSDNILKWRVFYWKLWDAESLVKGSRPTEAISYENAGIDADFLDSLIHPISCLPMLRETQNLFEPANGKDKDKGYELKQETLVAIKRIEKPLIASVKLRTMKQSMKLPRTSTRSKLTKTSGNPQVSPKLRDAVLRNNNYRCLYCGKGASDGAQLEAHHIITRSLINKLHLDPTLHINPENLCAACFSCNRGKSDNLATEDIEFYLNAFSKPEHPNHGLLRYLRKISELQTI